MVEQTALSEGHEIFTVTGGSKSIQIKSNRLLIRSKRLNKRKIKMQAINANAKYQSVVEKIIAASPGLGQHPGTVGQHHRNKQVCDFLINRLETYLNCTVNFLLIIYFF